LWITYHIAFFKPTVTPLLHNQDNFTWYGRFFGCKSATPYGASYKLGRHNSKLITWDGTWLNFPKHNSQCYMVYMRYVVRRSLESDTFHPEVMYFDSEGCTLTFNWLSTVDGDQELSLWNSQVPTKLGGTASLDGVTTGQVMVVKMLQPADVPIEDWNPRIRLTASSNILPDTVDCVDMDMFVTVVNKSFYDWNDEDEAWVMPFEDAEKPQRKNPWALPVLEDVKFNSPVNPQGRRADKAVSVVERIPICHTQPMLSSDLDFSESLETTSSEEDHSTELVGSYKFKDDRPPQSFVDLVLANPDLMLVKSHDDRWIFIRRESSANSGTPTPCFLGEAKGDAPM